MLSLHLEYFAEQNLFYGNMSELICKDDIFFFIPIKIGIKFSLYLFATLTNIIDNNSQFLRYSLLNSNSNSDRATLIIPATSALCSVLSNRFILSMRCVTSVTKVGIPKSQRLYFFFQFIITKGSDLIQNSFSIIQY